MTDKRPTWDEYFIAITKQVATRSTCLRRKVGAIIVNVFHVINVLKFAPLKF